VIASGFSYVAGYGLRLVPVIQSRSQLRAIYGPDVTDEIIANCGLEVSSRLRS
jgi:type IV secretion system protein VirD4